MTLSREQDPHNKRRKVDDNDGMLPHPLGIKPLGNALLAQTDPGFVDTRRHGLGYLGVLDDEFILGFLAEYLDTASLCALAAVSKVWYAFWAYDEIWKQWVLERWRGQVNCSMRWINRSWRQTYVTMVTGVEPMPWTLSIHIPYFHSDLLFNSHYYAHTSLDRIVHWLERSKCVHPLPTVNHSSVELFIEQYEQPNLPCLIRGSIDHWPARSKWTWDYLTTHYSKTKFRAEAIDIQLGDYLVYLFGHPDDEAPIYLFDKDFNEREPMLKEDFDIPLFFPSDLFSVLGNERPDFLWLIIGPERSGSTHHKDPNSTSAWNAVIRGAKLWIMYPPDVTPPGVFPSVDGSEVNTPLSLTDWWVNWLKETRLVIKDLPSSKWPQWGVCREGEVMFVPHGWWHTVINLEPSIAITRNYVSESNLFNVLEFLYSKRQMISGYKDADDQCSTNTITSTFMTQAVNLYEDFTSALRNNYSESSKVGRILSAFEVEKSSSRLEKEKKVSGGSNSSRRSNLWENIKEQNSDSRMTSSFSLFSSSSDMSNCTTIKML